MEGIITNMASLILEEKKEEILSQLNYKELAQQVNERVSEELARKAMAKLLA